MQHLDDGLLHALVDGEVPSAELGELQSHLDGCAACRARLDEARGFTRESDDLIQLLDVPAARPAARGGTGAAGRPASGPSRTWWTTGGRRLAWAASLVAAVGLGYTAGVRPWQAGASDPGAGVRSLATVPVENAAPAPAATEPATGGVEPSDRASDAMPDQMAARNRAPSPAEREAQSERSAPAEPVAEALASGARQEIAADAAPVRRRDEAAPLRTEPAAATPAAPPAPVMVIDRAVGAALEQRGNEAAKQVLVAWTAVDLPTAIRLLGGSLRLIEGLVPERLETAGRAVRVVYADGIVLEQRRDADSVVVALRGPAGLAADSLARLAARIR